MLSFFKYEVIPSGDGKRWVTKNRAGSLLIEDPFEKGAILSPALSQIGAVHLEFMRAVGLLSSPGAG